MDYKIEYPKKNEAVITFTIPKAEYEADIEAAKKATGSEDPAVAQEYALAQEGGKVFTEAAKEHTLKLATQPAFLSEADADGNVQVTLTCTLVPEVTLPAYTGLNFEKQPITVSEEEVLQNVMGRINQTNLFEPLPEDAVAEDGNQVVIDFVGEKDGAAFEGGSANDYPLVLGSHTFIPGFEDQLIGVKAGDERSVEVVFPSDYFEASLAGQPVIFKVTVKSVQKAIVPELNDEFIKKMNLEGCSTVDELKAKIREELTQMKTEQEENRLAMAILTRVAEGAQMDIPAAMIDSQVSQHMEQYENQLKQYGMSFDDFLKASKQTAEEFRARLVPEAENELRSALVLDAIASAEQIGADEKDLAKEYELLSTVYNFPPEQLKMFIPQEAVAAQITQRKTLEFLKANNTKKD
ncbi:trigger factor [uncultured Allobaculum sp.]|uniref:trigger factor n=1 Tax=uncultured Allobaculum sp. TaxID=1187017 RepID=UPI002586D0E9|nr:trigger factor [uncultured Allobaculum sp.]